MRVGCGKQVEEACVARCGAPCTQPRAPQVGVSSETKKQEEAHATKVAAAEALEAELLAAPKPAWPEVTWLPH